MTLADIVLQVFDVLVAGEDESKEPFVRAGCRQRLLWDLNDANGLLGGGDVRFGGT